MAKVTKKVARKTAGRTSKKATTKKTAAKKTATKRHSLSPEQRYQLVEQAAYFLAESDSFRRDPVDYWIEAEKQVAAGTPSG